MSRIVYYNHLGNELTEEEVFSEIWKDVKAEHKTNADHIRAMSDEELAVWINDMTTNALFVLALGSNEQTKNIFYWLDWLKKEVKE